MKTRLGYLNYINCLPPYYGILEEKVPIEARITPGLPHQLNSWLASKKLDLSPISSIEYARHQDEYLLLPELCLSSQGVVKSVILVSKLPLDKLKGKSIALSKTSATSQVLVKVLLSAYQPFYKVMPPKLQSMLLHSTAALLIGDEALQVKEEEGLFLYDLAELWQRYIGYAVIFAVWAVKKDYAHKFPEKTKEIVQAFKKSLDYGLKHLDEIVIKLFDSFQHVDLYGYFKNLKYEFGPQEQEALLIYYQQASKLGLCPSCQRLEFFK
ncbi:menaquinone biosynthesis protein [bacterium]|nr:menaquinone biosynthesis protein [bacterium]MBU0899556.1 menaquinone biosynthesis protein [bacterium]MBU1153537.1 menaquinone biosynthesis protein [bacterium]MBU1782278.1 menaquinone biosynthesis protein [bacterium]MBU2600106.1 menaquinone biosynthesis protein [bacterium]